MGEDEWAGTSWRVVEVDGRAVVGEATLVFDAEGRVAGRAVINRFFGSYTAEAGTVTFGPLGSTLMAGPPEEMAEERAVLGALSGTLTAQTEDGPGDGSVTLRGTTTLRLVPEPAAGAAGGPAPLV